MTFIEKSLCPMYGEPTEDPIFVFTQFYIPDDSRYKEIKEALYKNVMNPHIYKIILINERIYTVDELGIDSPKIQQIDHGSRLMYSDFFKISQSYPGYHVLINSDIELDESIQKIRESDIHEKKKMYWLLRYEKDTLFGNGRADSADTWIFHHNFPLTHQEQKVFKFPLGIPGCDNKVAYLCSILGYGIYNDPLSIRTLHHHASSERNYAPTLPPPYMLIIPYGIHITPKNIPMSAIETYTISMTAVASYVQQKEPFIITRISGIENIIACTQKLSDHLRIDMKQNAGIHFSGQTSVYKYSYLYLKAFEVCSFYASWEPWGKYIQHLGTTQSYIQHTYPKPTFSAYGFDIFHSIHEPWTHGLRGKRLLIISPFIDTIQHQPRKEIYGIDLFPECTLVYIKPPQTQGTESSRDWHVEYTLFCAELYKIKDTFDVALCSCGGYANPVCYYLYTIGKSAIYVGGVLQMYFGIYGNRWMKERPEIMKLYMNSHWKRPSSSETPLGASSIENKCYW
jgi:hypothetical protein